MKKRPLIVTVLSILYLLAPLWILLEFQVLFSVNVLSKNDWYYILSYHVAFMTILTMLAGYGMYKVRPWGYYLVILHSVIVITNNTILILKGITALSVYWTLVFNVFLLMVIFIFLRKEIYSPYFNPRLRWWEQARRFMTSGLKARLYKGRSKIGEYEVFDLSSTGIFLKIDDKLDSIDTVKEYTVSFPEINSLRLKLQAMWINMDAKKIPRGVGFKFNNITKLEKKAILRYIKQQNLKERER